MSNNVVHKYFYQQKMIDNLFLEKWEFVIHIKRVVYELKKKDM